MVMAQAFRGAADYSRGHRQLRGHWGLSMPRRCNSCHGVYLGDGFCNSVGCRKSMHGPNAWQRARRRQQREQAEDAWWQAEKLRRGPNLPSSGGSASTSAGQGAAEPLSASAPGSLSELQAQSGGAASSRFAAGAQAEGRPMAEAAVAGMRVPVEESPPDAVAEAVALLARLHPVLIRQKREGIVWDVEAESAATVHLLNELVFWDL